MKPGRQGIDSKNLTHRPVRTGVGAKGVNTKSIRQRVEAEWIEEHFQKGPRVRSEYDPFSPDRLK